MPKTGFKDIGIDSIGFYTPQYFVDLQKLAKARNIPFNKLKYGLMTYEMRVPAEGEDIVSLGLKAAKNALIRGRISVKDIDAVFVGTETMTYAVKSVSNIIKDLLGISAQCLTQDVYNACAAGTLAVLNAVAQIESGFISKALVIAVDISSYDLNSPGEPTQGAGAVAMVICKNPRIAVFSNSIGKVSGNINDFYRAAGEKTAQVFGKYSVESYLQLQLDAYDDFIKKAGFCMVDHYIFHSPYARLPLKFINHLIKERWLENPAFLTHINEIIEYIQTHPENTLEKWLVNPYFADFGEEELINDCLSAKITSLQEIPQELYRAILHFIRNRIVPPLQVPSIIGNMYSAAIWAELMFVLETSGRAGQTIMYGSYGSGATCITGLLKIQPKFERMVKRPLGILNYLPYKQEQSIKAYESIRNNALRPQPMWGKIQTFSEWLTCGMVFDFCDHGCNLTSYGGLSHCPKGHSGKNRLFFPLVGKLIETMPFDPADFTPFFNGYVLIDNNAKIGDIMEFQFRQWTPIKATEQSLPGLLNWLPYYTVAINSPYMMLAMEDESAPVGGLEQIPSSVWL